MRTHNIARDLPWPWDELWSSAYRVSRRREAVGWSIFSLAMAVTFFGLSASGAIPRWSQIICFPGSVFFLMDGVYELLWPTKLVRLRSASVYPTFIVSALAARYPYVNRPEFLWVIVLAGAVYGGSFCAAIGRWPIRRTEAQLVIDKWWRNQRRDIVKADLNEREDIIGVNIGFGRMRLKRLGDYVLIMHGMERRLDIDLVSNVRMEAEGPVRESDRTTIRYECDSYKGKGKTIKVCLDRLEAWKEDASNSLQDDQEIMGRSGGYFRTPERDQKNFWGMKA